MGLTGILLWTPSTTSVFLNLKGRFVRVPSFWGSQAYTIYFVIYYTFDIIKDFDTMEINLDQFSGAPHNKI